jgi:transcriptional regulator with XRE-family HTH domain
MGGPGSGRRTDPQRQRLATALRAQGLTFAEVGRQLGISREAARQMVLAAARCGRPAPPPCLSCALPLPHGNRGGRCPACVAADPATAFAERLQALRLAAGLTQAVLAARAGVSTSSVSFYEQGRGRPGLGNLAALARVLGPWLLAGTQRREEGSPP